ncbi:MAG: hypothetical protein AB7G12_17105 [Thermoanaerobaculia bacterium]
MKISRSGRGWLYALVAALFASGLLWWILDRWFPVAGEFGAEKHPAEPWLLRLHGLAAMLFLVLVGTLLPRHVRGGWRARLNRRSGAVHLAWNGLLAVTGYALYYAGSERLRGAASSLHLGLGLLLPLVLGVHVVRGRFVRRLRAGGGDPPKR